MNHIKLSLIGLFFAAQSLPAMGQFEAGFSPYVGGGKISDAAAVRHTSGYAVSIERSMRLSESFYLGPRAEYVAAGMSTKSRDQQLAVTRSFESNILAVGGRIAFNVAPSNPYLTGAYLTALVGRGRTALVANESTNATYIQSRYKGIDGAYQSAELGTWVPIKGSFGFNLALLTSQYKVDTTQASVTREGDQIDGNGNVFALTESANTHNLPGSLILRTNAIKFGLVLGF